ncbi:MAG TPA: FxLYD domain-containing protein [Nitrososphaeraceae archaeon]|nr:FxLYD domain-containing protein [Nitrososphaeraceae archaeon]
MNRTLDKKPLYVLYSVVSIFTLAALSLYSIESFSIGVVSSSSNLDNLISSSASNSPVGDILNSKYLEISNYSFSKDLLFTIVNGTVINNSNNTINSAEVTVLFYDDNNTLITSSTENARFIIMAPGENSSFSVRSDLGDEIVSRYSVIPGGDIEAS